MKIKELKNKTSEELTKLYNDNCVKLQELSFKVSSQQLKDVREVRETRKTIAQILTLLNASK